MTNTASFGPLEEIDAGVFRVGYMRTTESQVTRLESVAPQAGGQSGAVL